jgi:hypothetical protein
MLSQKRQNRNEQAKLSISLAISLHLVFMQVGKQNDYVNFRPKELIFSFLPVLPNFRFFGRITEVRPENFIFQKRGECSYIDRFRNIWKVCKLVKIVHFLLSIERLYFFGRIFLKSPVAELSARMAEK